jgi:Protein of unknown function (DUF3102)
MVADLGFVGTAPMQNDRPPTDADYLAHSMTLARATEARPAITPELAALAADVLAAQAQIVAGIITILEGSIALGEALRVLKKQVPHGEWEDFVGYHCRMSTVKAQRYMRLARNKALISQHKNWKESRVPLSQRAALKLVSVTKAKRRKGWKRAAERKQ